jgi:predicted transcriptional regulator
MEKTGLAARIREALNGFGNRTFTLSELAEAMGINGNERALVGRALRSDFAKRKEVVSAGRGKYTYFKVALKKPGYKPRAYLRIMRAIYVNPSFTTLDIASQADVDRLTVYKWISKNRELVKTVGKKRVYDQEYIVFKLVDPESFYINALLKAESPMRGQDIVEAL